MASSTSSVSFQGEIDPELLEKITKKHERRERMKNALDEKVSGIQTVSKIVTDGSIVGVCIGTKITLSVVKPEVASVVNPVLGCAQAPVMKAKHKYVDPKIDDSVVSSISSVKWSIDKSCC